MIRDFTKEEVAPAGHATEVTLGSGAFLALGTGLFLMCALCFGLGYAVGHRSAPEVAAVNDGPPQDLRTPVGAARSGGKPGAAGQAPVQAAAQATENGSGDAPAQGIQGEAADPGSAGNDGPLSEAQPRSAFQVQSAAKQPQGWMVQIAAVSHPEDAEVLVDALRKHGYSALARRDASDNLIHVQTGPFVNRNDANAMRQKLLNDGYNAIVQ